MSRDHIKGWEFFSRFDRWHFLNVPRDTRDVSASHCADNCVLKGIEFHSARLANHSLEDRRRAEALFFLGHWIGDVHQPLHVSYTDDLGGNEIRVSGGFYTAMHLHGVWDSGIISKVPGTGGWQPLAIRLRNGITPALRDTWRADPPLEWAQESYAITVTPEVDYCQWDNNDEGGLCRSEAQVRRLRMPYQTMFQDDVEVRLQKAGVRLAARLRSGLGLH